MKPYNTYANDVVSGKIVACELVKLACQRHLDDANNLPKSRFKFSEELADYYINFAHSLKLSKGKSAGNYITLQPWQQFMVASIFGWLEYRDEQWVRRFRKVYIEIPRKNGKSTIAAVIALATFIADQEGGPEVYCAATSRKQASIVFDEVKSMVRQNEHLSEFIEVLSKSVAFADKTSGVITTLASNSDRLSGLNTHCAIIDELHEHPNRGIVDIVTTSTSARSQPLIFEITTAGRRMDRICYEHHKYSTDVLRGIITDDNWFSLIYTIDKDDDWKDEAIWLKANPNLNVSGAKSLEYMRSEFTEASISNSKSHAFQQLDLNVWVFGADGWIADAEWVNCQQDIDWDKVKELPCWAGLDLAQSKDFSALAFIFFDAPNKRFYFKSIQWAASDNIRQMADKYDPNIMQWANDGYIRVTDGNIMDTDLIEAEILKELKALPNFQSLAYDRMFAHQLILHLEKEGIRCQHYAQNVHNMAAPTASVEADIKNGAIIHEADPVFRWMLSNAQIKRVNDMPKIIRNSAKFKIDAVIALIMAYGQYMTDAATIAAPKVSIYETRGIIKI